MKRLLLLLLLIMMVPGCSNVEAVEESEKYISPVEKLDIIDGVRVIGLGEATHGNVEFQQLKKDVENEDVHVFVLEGDFGAGQLINQFILSGEGAAKDVVSALDYDIYKTEEMIEFVQWMHDYNMEVSEDEKIWFYGNDMQRYDASKQKVLEFYHLVSEEKAALYREKLSLISNQTMRDLTEEELRQVMETLEEISSDLIENEQSYIERSPDEQYAFALQNTKVMKQRTELFLTNNYSQLRDQYLAENLKWIVDYERSRGHEKVLVSGHNGHIEKTSANAAGYKSMGNYLDELYGSEYFAIGTDFLESEFQAKNGNTGKREVYKVENNNELVTAFQQVENNNELVTAFQQVEDNVFYVDFSQASKSEELLNIISSRQKMGNIGDEFHSWYKLMKRFYTIEMIPDEAYDGVIIVKKATPTKIME
ncbi:erythromycin esterase [Gracilibacillus ureilyticus]|uniref:Erythromycin esterase n=1 Tax=Gracilibacillus ureilyticus TaxID=531814 RepID=A0A1H9NDV2_9BACI|nr:erythromycin esterase family protein [Gracilibacillus ureilyticus]SER34146.1 erythromycin esterase [Gracilibacillus ureilyticus]